MSPAKSSTLLSKNSYEIFDKKSFLPPLIPKKIRQEFTTRIAHKINLWLMLLGIVFMMWGVLGKSITSSLNISYWGIQNGTNKDSFILTRNPKQKFVTVTVDGAVEKPGRYDVPDDSRVLDVLITAGGLSPKADRKTMSGDLTLSQVVFDGMRIEVPELYQNLPITINLNQATPEQLDQLYGVGPAISKKIIENRPFSKIEELLERKIVSKKVFLIIQQQIIVE